MPRPWHAVCRHRALRSWLGYHLPALRTSGNAGPPEPFPSCGWQRRRGTMRTAALAGISLALLLGVAASPALAQSAPLEMACRAGPGLRCGIGLVDGGQVLILHADGSGWVGKRLALAADGQAHALDAQPGKLLLFEVQGPAAPPTDSIATLGNVHLLYVVAPVAGAKSGG